MSFEEPNDPRSSEIGNNQIQLTELATYEERTPGLHQKRSVHGSRQTDWHHLYAFTHLRCRKSDYTVRQQESSFQFCATVIRWLVNVLYCHISILSSCYYEFVWICEYQWQPLPVCRVLRNSGLKVMSWAGLHAGFPLTETILISFVSRTETQRQMMTAF